MQLVINGDDLGYTKANTLGIIEAYKQGILRSTTALANSRYLEWAAQKTCDCENLGIGVHLTLTLGQPLTKGTSFVGENGNFLGARAIREAELDMDEIYAEWHAQVERFIEVFKKMPTHLDSHHGVHDFNEKQLCTARKLADEYGLELRRYGRFSYVDGFWNETATADTLIQIMEDHAGENIELMTHPGFCDLELYRASSYNTGRVRELDALCDPRVLAYVQEHHVELCHY